jgi:hypothetical protein
VREREREEIDERRRGRDILVRKAIKEDGHEVEKG